MTEPTAEPSNDENAPTTLVPPALQHFPLGQRLKETGRHPVLVFGNTSSGKSTILMSLIAAVRTNPDVNISLGEPIYPLGHPRRNEAHDWAVDFFQRRAEAFIRRGEVLTATETHYPFLIPIDIRRTRAAEPMRLAFLEGKGEWYEPSTTGPSLYQGFKPEVADVLKFYDGGLSTIFVAPTSNHADPERLRQNDIGLMGALTEYRQLRARAEMDSLLFLLSKWDVHADPITDRKFAFPTGADIDGVLARQYPDAWGEFQSMPRSLGNDRRYFMQYVAGYIREEKNRPPPEVEAAHFERYPRTLLNWLYGNTSETGVALKRREILFDEVQLPSRNRLRILQQVTNFIFVRG